MSPIPLGIVASSAGGAVAPYVADAIHYGTSNDSLTLEEVIFESTLSVPADAKFLLITATNDNRSSAPQLIDIITPGLSVAQSFNFSSASNNFFEQSDLSGSFPPGLVNFAQSDYACDPVVYVFDIEWVKQSVWAQGNGLAVKDNKSGGYVDSVIVAVIAGDVVYDPALWKDGTIVENDGDLPEVQEFNLMSFSGGPKDLLVFSAGFLDDDQVTMGADEFGNYTYLTSGFTSKYPASSVLYYRLEEGVNSPFRPLAWQASGFGNDSNVGMTFAFRSA